MVDLRCSPRFIAGGTAHFCLSCLPNSNAPSDHEHVLQPCQYMVMELLGSNLMHLVKQRPNRQLSLSTVSRLALQMVRAIESLHEQGFVHRDVKASNFVMSLDSSSCRLIDFGLARRYRNDDGSLREVCFYMLLWR